MRKSTIKWPTNSGMHIDQWVDGENVIHTFYEPVYPGQSKLNSFNDLMKTSEPTGEEKDEETPIEELPY